MIVIIKSLVFNALKDELVKLHVVTYGEDRYDNKGYKAKGRHIKDDAGDCEVDLSSLTKSEAESLSLMLDNCGVHGSKRNAADVRKFLRASTDGVSKVRARNCRQAAWMLEHFFSELPHHTIFSKDEYGGNSHSGYYVGDVDFEPAKKGDRSGYRQPAECQVDLWHVENDVRIKSRWTLRDGDCLEMTCLEMLAESGYIPETPLLMERLRAETERYYEETPKIGHQYIATGIGLCDLDDATESKNHYGSDKVKMDHFGSARVVIDILHEKDDADSRRNRRSSESSGLDPYRWHKWNARFHTPKEDEIVRHLDADENCAEPVDVDVPVHPLAPCFDLRRHTRLRVHVNNLTPYPYNRAVADRLVLPERDWKMVNLLVDHSANLFNDIVANKGMSMNVLAVGPPGTGKTATAEIFSEFKGRPLYTVQCSQLGMKADSVEDNLSIIMQRANRWNAVLLLDEADVYIAKRGSDLNQNAIVGVFLRVLEYASCILFMTSNREDCVDDAIASRCIAMLRYGAPGESDQARIWRILADINKLSLSDAEIHSIAHAHPHLTGRDVKNLLKLASFVSQQSGEPITRATVEYAMQFKPTETMGGRSVQRGVVNRNATFDLNNFILEKAEVVQ